MGYGDNVDFRQVNLTEDGTYTFSTAADNAAKMTLWGYDDKHQLKNLRTATGNANRNATASLYLGAGTYFLSVEATQASRGKNANYTISCNVG